MKRGKFNYDAVSYQRRVGAETALTKAVGSPVFSSGLVQASFLEVRNDVIPQYLPEMTAEKHPLFFYCKRSERLSDTQTSPQPVREGCLTRRQVPQPGREDCLIRRQVPQPGREDCLTRRQVHQPGREDCLTRRRVPQPGREDCLTRRQVPQPVRETCLIRRQKSRVMRIFNLSIKI
jgi:hypothetical protein